MAIHTVDVAVQLTLAALALIDPALQASEQRTYVSDEFKYSLQVPPSWHLSVAESRVVTLLNYDPRDAGPQGLFPDQGAEIHVIPLAAVQAVTHAKTIDEWITANLSATYRAPSRRHLANPVRLNNAPRDVVEVDADFLRDPQDEQLQREINYYFTLRGAPFRLRLLFWKGDPHSSSYRSALRLVLRSMRGDAG